ncbi:glycosyltransferase [Gloeocapsa sp. PCC 73106]|uniref:glycosyltransferase n=1 Tax=Gloeocapsa sp. PCC 73106 TaxID=102232 RepID=UPI0002ABBC68|nr:glycosyltransferase [Gloeocapsa sp. PCC 73106]ELR98315.1 glycosyltransferase [Gloeocapsa sp. PCC 73106]
MTNPLVTIGLPVFNEEKHIERTIISWLAQDYDNFELVIVDNASEDKTQPICLNYTQQDPRIKYYRNEQNIGSSSNFKKAFDLAKGQYFIWSSGHDDREKNFLSSCAQVMETKNTIVLCYSQANWIDTNGKDLGVINGYIDTRGLSPLARFNLVLWGIGYCYPIYGLFRTEALRKIPLNKQVIGPDVLILLELSILGEFAYVPEPLLKMRKMPDYGSWEQYVQKHLNKSLSELSGASLFWQMITEYSKVVEKYFTNATEKAAAFNILIDCLLTKYSWILQGLMQSSQQANWTNDPAFNHLQNLIATRSNYSQLIEKQIFETENIEATEKKITKVSGLNGTILIDGVFFQLYQTGIARVWKSLLEEWAKDGFAQYFTVLDRAETAPKIPGICYRTIANYDYNKTESDRALLQQICDEEQTQIFISSYYTTPLDTPSVFMAYDMIPEVLGGDLNQPMWRQKQAAIQHASAYISISANTAKDLAKYFPEIELDSVTVAHCGVQSLFTPASAIEIAEFKTKYGISKPYFIITGGGGYKNPLLFFQALAKLPTKQGFEVVVTGAGGLLAPDLRELAKGVIVHRLQLSDAELRLAYSGAVALVYPSKYEGFGLPVLEAMSCGTPVITTANASIPEVGGEAVIYISDRDADALVEALCEVQKPKIRENLITLGLQQARKFDWSQMARKVSDALIAATLLPLNLRVINLIVFPDWSQNEDNLYEQFLSMLGKIATHPEQKQMTLLIDTQGIEFEDANLFLSSVMMNIMMEEDLNLDEELQISLVPELYPRQWSYLLTQIQGRIALRVENTTAIREVQAENLTTY